VPIDCNEVDELILALPSLDPFERDELRGLTRAFLDDDPGFELVDGDLDAAFFGKGSASSGV